jgi:hypothetical protein
VNYSLDIDDGEEGVLDLLNDGVIVGSELCGRALGILFAVATIQQRTQTDIVIY